MERKPKTIFQLDSPFADVQCIVSAIGQFRASNTAPSKGKRCKKRKREEKKLKEEDPEISSPPLPEISSFLVVGLNSITRSLETLSQKSKALRILDCEKNDASQKGKTPISEAKRQNSIPGQLSQSSMSKAKSEASSNTEKPSNDAGHTLKPPSSEIKRAKSERGRISLPSVSGVRSGVLNSTEKPPKDNDQIPEPAISEAKSQKSALDNVSGARSENVKGSEGCLIECESGDRHFAAIFVPRSSQPSILHAHLPQLVVTASLAHPELPHTRLVQLPKGCDGRLCEALGLPRVSFIGLLDGAPHSKSLIDLVQECVPEIETPWLQEAKKSVYLPVKINVIESFVPVPKKEQQKVAARGSS